VREILFAGTNQLSCCDGKTTAIAVYVKANPSVKVGLDGAMTPANVNQTMARVNAVRSALLSAGVAANRIELGIFTDTDKPLVRDGRVSILLRSR